MLPCVYLFEVVRKVSDIVKYTKSKLLQKVILKGRTQTVMAQRNSVARVYGVMQELQQLRDKVCTLSEKNIELAKALVSCHY